MDEYPSIPMFLEKGFRVLPTSWKDTTATKALIQYSYQQKHPKMLGHLFTTWSQPELLEYPALLKGMKFLKELERKRTHNANQ